MRNGGEEVTRMEHTKVLGLNEGGEFPFRLQLGLGVHSLQLFREMLEIGEPLQDFKLKDKIKKHYDLAIHRNSGNFLQFS